MTLLYGYMLYEAPGHNDRELLARFASRVLYTTPSIVVLKAGDYAINDLGLQIRAVAQPIEALLPYAEMLLAA